VSARPEPHRPGGLVHATAPVTGIVIGNAAAISIQLAEIAREARAPRERSPYGSRSFPPRSTTEWIFFGLLAVGLFLARRRAGYRPAYRVWGYPVVPAIFLAASMVIVVNQVVTDPRESAVGLGFVAIGLPVYALWARTRPRTSAGVPTHAGDRLP